MKKLSIVVPIYNEEKTLLEILRRIDSLVPAGGLSKEVVLVNDASTDSTSDLLAQLPSHYLIVHHKENAGKGASLIDGFKKATGDVVVVQDADLEYDPENINDLLGPILDGKADVVYGSRFLGGKPHRVLYFWHYVGNTFLTLFSNMFTNLNLSDMETCYKMFTREVIDDIKGKLISQRFGIEPEITARVKRYRLYEVGVSYAGRTYEEGKKIGWKDGVSAIWSIVKFNLFP
jgi:glycosyltransferase involved in cell wall biosynthesis